MKPIERETTRSAHHRIVIETVSTRGAGVAPDPVREVVQYWSGKGQLLAENDPCAHMEDINGLFKLLKTRLVDDQRFALAADVKALGTKYAEGAGHTKE